nr:hypothetical protein [Tanacetum cinerariifolium]
PGSTRAARVSEGVLKPVVSADSADDSGFRGESDRCRGGQSEGFALRVVHNGLADCHGVLEYGLPAPVQTHDR